ncbi:hypothetical protein TNCV_3072501 [Trichonephila clavipes]|nr:hypothetical protein TNCV_3072501 [Trichonephila clavipes]
MATTRYYVTSACGRESIVYCLNSESADTQTRSQNGKGEPAPIDNRRSLSRKNPVVSAGVERMDNRTQETREELYSGSRELEGEKSPGWRELEERSKERDLVRDWSGKQGKTMNAGGMRELE